MPDVFEGGGILSGFRFTAAQKRVKGRGSIPRVATARGSPAVIRIFFLKREALMLFSLIPCGRGRTGNRRDGLPVVLSRLWQSKESHTTAAPKSAIHIIDLSKYCTPQISNGG